MLLSIHIDLQPQLELCGQFLIVHRDLGKLELKNAYTGDYITIYGASCFYPRRGRSPHWVQSAAQDTAFCAVRICRFPLLDIHYITSDKELRHGDSKTKREGDISEGYIPNEAQERAIHIFID